MEALTVEEIVTATDGKLLSGDLNRKINNISIDSRTIKPNDLFIAIKGKNFDGHSFVSEALAKGAIGAVVADANIKSSQAILIKVKDTREALGNIARYYRGKFKPLVIAVTGSNGKTTTKEMIAGILGKRMRIVKAKDSFNNEIGVPLTILGIDSQTQALILEIEMNLLGGTRRLAEIAKPQIGVVTNVGDTHLEFLGSRENVMREKAELIESLTPDGVAILNADDELVMAIGENFPKIQKLTFGLNQPADIFAKQILDLTTNGCHFMLQGKYRTRLHLLGTHNIYNALAAIATVKACGFDFAPIVSAIEEFRPVTMRMEIVRIKDLTVINDTYNANPQSMKTALATLAKIDSDGKKIVVLGDMLELGAGSEFFHYTLGQEAAKIADVILAIGKFSRNVIEGALQVGINPENARNYENNKDLLTNLIDIIQPKDTILIKGSRAMHLEWLLEGLKTEYEKKTD
ncbi:MAG: UDP-N-acetylmuramoyl-tripeptide--D-alanyl-D-alanine ligase [candidate division WOR-3 bacterium]